MMQDELMQDEQWLDKRTNRIITALIINAALILIYMLLYYPAYETNDDSGLNCIVSGVRGAMEPHLIYVNYYWGLLLKNLYIVAPDIPWTAVLQYIILFVSFVAVSCVLMKRLRNLAYLPLIVGFLALYEYEGYVLLQYTKTAGFAAVAGLALIFGELFSSKESKVVLFIGLLLCWIASMYRFQQFLATIGIFSAFVLYFLLCLPKLRDDEGASVKQKLIIASVTAVLILGGAFGLLALDKLQYTSDSWKEYTAYNKVRTEVTDFGLPSYDEYEDEYLELGIDKSAYRLMRSWSFHDSEKFTTETFQTIAAWRKRPEINAQFFKSFLRKFFTGLRLKEFFWVFLLLAFGWLLCGRHGIREILFLIYGAAITFVLYGYLFYMERFLIHRVDVGIWFALSVLVLWLYESDKAKRGLIIGAVLLVLIMFCEITKWDDHWRINTTDKRIAAAKEKAVIEEINSDHDHLYLTKVGAVSFHKAYNAFDQAPFGVGDNIYGMGGWTAAMPLYQSILHRYGVENPYRDMIDNEKVYLIDNKIDLTLDYLKTWYNKDAEAEKVKKVGSHTVYRIVTNKHKG